MKRICCIIALVFCVTFLLFLLMPNYNVKQVASIVDESNKRELVDVEEPFYEDNTHIYIFSNPISKYVIVKYTDGSKQNVKEALESGNIEIAYLDKYGIKYYAEPKLVDNIVDLTQSGELITADALEGFYKDENYTYFFGSIKSHYVIVYYKDGTEQNVREALAEEKIKITDLDWFDIKYGKEPLNKQKE